MRGGGFLLKPAASPQGKGKKSLCCLSLSISFFSRRSSPLSLFLPQLLPPVLAASPVLRQRGG